MGLGLGYSHVHFLIRIYIKQPTCEFVTLLSCVVNNILIQNLGSVN